MRQIFWMILGLCFCVLSLRAETFQLTDGGQLTGEIINFNDTGITMRSGETYTNIVWTKLSQDSLKELSKDPKKKSLIEPFIEIPPEERAKREDIKIHDVNRLKQPPTQSLIAALFSSSVGIILLLVVYAA